MSRIEPNEEFFVKYGNDHSVKVRALNMRQKRNMLKLLNDLKEDSNPVDTLDIIEKCLPMCVVDYSDEWLDTLDEEMAMQVVQATMERQSLSSEELGKLESPHS